MILETLTVGPFQENCYVIGDESTGEGALVDPGDEAARIALAVEQTGLEVGGLRLKALYTPGHAPGHLAFYLESEGLVLSGDALFAGSVGRTDLFGGDMELLLRSINERLLALPDETRVYPGHGPQTTVGDERRYNPFLQQGGLL